LKRSTDDPAGSSGEEETSPWDGTPQKSWRFLLIALLRRLTHVDHSSGRNEAIFEHEMAETTWLGRFAFEGNRDYSRLVKERADATGGAEAEVPTHVAGGAPAGTALMILRTYRALTQKRLAELSGVNKATISSYEHGRQPVGGASLERLLDAMELPLRAWESTLRHVEWLRWLGASPDRQLHARGHSAAETEPSGEVTDRAGPEISMDLRQEIRRIAELAGREREMKIARVLEIMTQFLE